MNSKKNLDERPVGHPAVPRDGVEVEIVVQIVHRPPDLQMFQIFIQSQKIFSCLPDGVGVFSVSCAGLKGGVRAVPLQVVHSDVPVLQSGRQHVGVLKEYIYVGAY